MQNYTVKKVIGEGAYGRAVICVENATGELCVIKEIAMANLSAQEQRDAKKEVKILSSLHHPNIIGYRASFNAQNVLHIVMDYADNGDLFTQIQNARGVHFKEEQILDWFVQICLALKHIHDRKILHRDIKCQNIFMMKNGMIKMGDFGIAKILDHTTQFSKTAIGTPYYLSPEICEGKAYNSKSDIWSLGCVLYELCTLNHAFDANCMNGLIMKILRSKHAPIPYYYSPQLRTLVDNLLNKNAAKRPSINQILKLDFIRNRIGNLLSATMQKIEFSHTVFHKVKACETPEALKPENFHKQELQPIQEDKVVQQQQKPLDLAPPKQHVKPTPKPYAPLKQAQPPMPEKAPAAKRPSPANVPAKKVVEKAPVSKVKSPKLYVEKPPKGGMKLTSHQNHSKEELLKKKSEMVSAERERQKQLKAAREEEQRKAEELAAQKRAEVEEKHRQAALERKKKMEQLNREAAARKKKFDNLEAPFKAQMKAPPAAAPASKARKPPPVKNSASSNEASPRSTGSNSSDNERASKPPSRPISNPHSEEEEKPKNVTVRPGKVKKRDEEVQNLREMIKRRRAELRAQKKAEQENYIQIGGIAIPADQTPAPEPPKQEEPPKVEEKNQPEVKQEEKKPEVKEEPKVEEKNQPETKQEEQKQQPKKSFQELIDMSSSDESDDEADDLIELAAIAKSIFDNPPDDDEAEEEGEEHVEEPKAAPGKFIFNGKELILECVSGDDSLSYRVEALRMFIEEGLGLDTFLAIYQLLTDDSDNMSDADIDKKTKEILHTKEQLNYYPLLNQLIKCEDTLNQAS